jgi:hypothetical protein
LASRSTLQTQPFLAAVGTLAGYDRLIVASALALQHAARERCLVPVNLPVQHALIVHQFNLL